MSNLVHVNGCGRVQKNGARLGCGSPDTQATCQETTPLSHRARAERNPALMPKIWAAKKSREIVRGHR